VGGARVSRISLSYSIENKLGKILYSLKAIKDYLVNTVQSSISQIQNNTRTSVAIPEQMLRPASGSSLFKVYVNIYDNEGNMEDPDDQDSGAEQAMVAVAVVDESGNDRSSNLSGLSASTQGSLNWLTRDSEGRFSCIYSVSNTHDLEQLLFTFDYLEGAAARKVDRATIVTGTLDISDTVDDIYTEITSGTYGLAALKTLIDNYLANGGSIETRFDDIDTDLTSIESKIDTIDSVVDGNSSLLNNATYGLSALKTLIDALGVDIDSVTADLTSVKGTGFVTGSDSLKAISDRQQAIQGATWSSSTDSLEAIRDAIDGIDVGNGGYIA
jgi:archaellum component FlaC